MTKTQTYTGNINPSDSHWKESAWTKLLVERYTIAASFCSDKTILDSCCGTGWGTIKFISPIASNVTGFDICSTLNTISAPDNVTLVQMDAKNITIQENNFDIALALDSIEHFTQKDGIEYLKGLKRTLKASGLLIGSTPLVPDDCLIPVYLKQNKYHYFMYTQNILKETLSSIFPSVRIFKIYNRICPYFVFFCEKETVPLDNNITGIMSTFINKNKKDLLFGKLISNLRWAKNMVFVYNIRKTFFFLGRSLLALIDLIKYECKTIYNNKFVQ